MAETPARSSSDGCGGGKILRRSNSSRLRMHAPSSIQVTPASGCVSEWKVAIPLLSPLDMSSSLPRSGEIVALPELQRQNPTQVRREEGKGDAADIRWPAWQHPAAPFYYEPVPSNAPAFVASYCALT